MPVTFTLSLKVTWIGMTSPVVYVPFAFVELTSVTVGCVLSIV